MKKIFAYFSLLSFLGLIFLFFLPMDIMSKIRIELGVLTVMLIMIVISVIQDALKYEAPLSRREIEELIDSKINALKSESNLGR